MSIDEQVPRSDAATPKDDTDLDKEDFYELRDDEFTLEADDNVSASTSSSAPPPLPPWAAESRSLLAGTREDDSTIEVDQPSTPLRAEAPSELSAREKLKRLVHQVIAREIYVKEVELALNTAIGRGHGQAFRIAELELELREVHAQLARSEQARVALESQALRDRELAAVRSMEVALASQELVEPSLEVVRGEGTSDSPDAASALQDSVLEPASMEVVAEAAFAAQIGHDDALSEQASPAEPAPYHSAFTLGRTHDTLGVRRTRPESPGTSQLAVAPPEAARTARLPNKSAHAAQLSRQSARATQPPKRSAHAAQPSKPSAHATQLLKKSARPTSAAASLARATTRASTNPARVAPKPKATRTPDDLSKIAGIGVRTIAQLHKLGVTSFAKIAGWTASDVSRIAKRLATSPERIQREAWIKQARALGKARTTRKTK